MVVAYLSKNPFYAITKPSYHMNELLAEFKQYKVRYYFFYYQTQQEKDEFLKGSIAGASINSIALQPGLLIFQFY
jgi:hypothetical protein